MKKPTQRLAAIIAMFWILPTAGLAQDPVPAEEVVIAEVARPLFTTLQLGRPAAKTPRLVETARNLLAAMLIDEELDATEQALLRELLKPGFRVRVKTRAEDGPVRELVYLGTFRPDAREVMARLVPPDGSTRPQFEGQTRQYFWFYTGKEGWERVIAHAEKGEAERAEMVAVIEQLVGGEWTKSSVANGFGPVKAEIERLQNSVANLKGAHYGVALRLLLAGCLAVDERVKDALPDFLYSDLRQRVEDLGAPQD